MQRPQPLSPTPALGSSGWLWTELIQLLGIFHWTKRPLLPAGPGTRDSCSRLMVTAFPLQDDTISINHNWVNGCNLASMWHFLQRELCAVQQEISEWRDSMPEWHHHCQVRLAGLDWEYRWDPCQG